MKSVKEILTMSEDNLNAYLLTLPDDKRKVIKNNATVFRWVNSRLKGGGQHGKQNIQKD